MTREDAISTIQELMIACTPDSKYYRVGQMAISAILENEELSKDLDEALEEIDGYERGLSQKQKPIECEDAVSRQSVLDCFTATKLKKFDFILYAREEIKKLPSVTQKSGKWIGLYVGNGEVKYECSVCGFIASEKWKYCCECGADMKGEGK